MSDSGPLPFNHSPLVCVRLSSEFATLPAPNGRFPRPPFQSVPL
jgi:hypothetical protein